jgi:hypothetical protein
MGIFKGIAAYALSGRMGPTLTPPPGASTTAASVVSNRKVKVSWKYSSTTVLEWLK